ncbi:MAG: hypothetical protein JW804_08555 [Sedimentisphaerales bacterium]|nr:hypothetical protein [Sedimentisphaerales bacterium]
MDLPDDIKIQGVLVQGGAFKAKLDKDDYGRFYFILNKNPQDDIFIILSTSTTAFDLHRSCPDGDDVHISLTPDDYPPFYKNCLICCGTPKLLRKEQKNNLLMKLKSDKYELLPPLPPVIIEKIKIAISKSSTIPPAIKKLVLGPEENHS